MPIHVFLQCREVCRRLFFSVDAFKFTNYQNFRPNQKGCVLFWLRLVILGYIYIYIYILDLKLSKKQEYYAPAVYQSSQYVNTWLKTFLIKVWIL